MNVASRTNPAPIYDNSVGSSKFVNLYIRAEVIWRLFFLPRLRDIIGGNFSGKVLEIGAGMGHKLVVFQEAFPDASIYGIDPSRKMREIASRRRVTITDGVAEEIPFRDGEFELVHLPQVWHHIPLANREKVIQEIVRVLKPGGFFVMVDYFAPEASDPKMQHTLYEYSHRFYAVLSQHPTASVILRTVRACHSVISPDRYNLEEYGYFSTKKSELIDLIERAGFLIDKGLFYKFCPVSEMLVFQKPRFD